jgi:hypothetical protein
MRLERNEQREFNAKLKIFLFSLFFVEGNSRWVTKFNKQIMKCHDRMETNFRTNYDLD